MMALASSPLEQGSTRGSSKLDSSSRKSRLIDLGDGLFCARWFTLVSFSDECLGLGMVVFGTMCPRFFPRMNHRRPDGIT